MELNFVSSVCPSSCPCVGQIKKQYDFYAFTIRKTMKKGGEPNAVQYVDFWLNHEKKKGFETDVMKFEYKGGCHAHGILKFDLSCPTHISENPQKYLSQRGWHIYIKPLTDREIWINYISKEEKHISRSKSLFKCLSTVTEET